MFRMVPSQIFCRLIRPLTGWGFLLFFASCATYRTFDIEILAPAAITLESGSKVGFLDRRVRRAEDTSFILYRYPGIGPDELGMLFYNGLTARWTEDGRRDTLPAYAGSRIHYMEGDTVPDSYGTEEIRKLCESLGLDYLVSLEAYFYSIEPANGIVGNNYAVRLYAADRAKAVDFVIYSDNLTDYLSEDTDFVAFMQDKAWEKGDLYAERLTPHWTPARRRIYNQQKVLRTGDVFFRNDDPVQAEKLWMAATQSAPKIAFKAYINLAWLYENQGDFEKAARLLETARQLTSGHKLPREDVKYLNEYIRTIEKRCEDFSLIEKQWK